MATSLTRSARRARRGGFRALGNGSTVNVSPASVQSGRPIVRSKPLHEQFQRIGGGLTPRDVSWIIQSADAGQPAQLVDLFHESRQKDGHIHSICETRDMAVTLCDLEFVEPPDPSPKEQEATDLCRRIRDDFRNWPTLTKHLTRSYLYGHATTALKPWELVDGYLIPNEAAPIHPRDFIFSEDDGSLRYRLNDGDITGVDLLAKNPGRVIQIQRSIVGDAPVREGLMRLLTWMALFRNWDLRDWMALAEIGWKPWRIANYKKGVHGRDMDTILEQLELIGSNGIGVFPEGANFSVEWPKASGGSSQRSTHLELFDALGREGSKAVLGQTTSVESGQNGTRSDTETRDALRTERREDDALHVAAALRYHMFGPAVRINFGDRVRCPVPLFNTADAPDRVSFSTALEKLSNTGMPIPAKWARDEIGMPTPEEGEEILPVQLHSTGSRKWAVLEDLERAEAEANEPDPEEADSSDPEPPQGEDDGESEESPGKASKPGRARHKAVASDPQNDGAEYTDRLVEAGAEAAAVEMAGMVGEFMSLIDEQASDTSTDDQTKKLRLRNAVMDRYREELPPTPLAELMSETFTKARLGGMLAVRVEDGGLEPDEDD